MLFSRRSFLDILKQLVSSDDNETRDLLILICSTVAFGFAIIIYRRHF